jgi:hypothetical protein
MSLFKPLKQNRQIDSDDSSDDDAPVVRSSRKQVQSKKRAAPVSDDENESNDSYYDDDDEGQSVDDELPSEPQQALSSSDNFGLEVLPDINSIDLEHYLSVSAKRIKMADEEPRHPHAPFVLLDKHQQRVLIAWVKPYSHHQKPEYDVRHCTCAKRHLDLLCK